MKWLSILFILFITLGVALLGSLLWLTNSGNSLLSGEIETDGIQNEALIKQTTKSFSLIEADGNDFYFALGLTHARESLWEMNLLKLASKSELNLLFGDNFLQADIYSTLITNASEFDNIDEELAVKLEAYVSGVNLFINENRRSYPVEFTLTNSTPELWAFDDVIKIMQLINWLKDTSWQSSVMHQFLASQIPVEIQPFLMGRSFVNKQLYPTSLKWVLDNEYLLRKTLNFSTTLPFFSESNIHHENSKFKLINFNSGFNINPLFKPVIRISNDGTTLLQTIPGYPLPIAALNDTTFSFPESHLNVKVETKSVDAESQSISISKKSEAVFSFNTQVSNGSFKIPEGESTFILFEPVEIYKLLSHYDNYGNNQELTGNLSDSFDSELILEKISSLSATPDSSLSDITNFLIEITNQSNDATLSTINSYLSNWDFVYSSNSVAPGFVDEFLRQTSLAALSNYYSEDELNQLQSSPFFNNFTGINLTRYFLQSLDDSLFFSPVGQDYFERRVNDTHTELTNRLDNQTINWRWANRFSSQKNDFSLCDANTHFLSISSAVCVARKERFDYVPSGNTNSIFQLSAIPFKENGIHSITTTLFGVHETETGNQTLFILDEDDNPSSFLIEKSVRGSTIPIRIKTFDSDMPSVKQTIRIIPVQ